MSAALDELVQTLLYEGYALYPYTGGATKNATPTPFGIVYPPAYAAGSAATFDHLQVECLVEGPDPQVEAAVLFLQPTGERHQAAERRVDLDGPGEREVEHDGVRARVELSHDRDRVRLRVENLTEVPPGLTRPEALERALVSTQVVLRTRGGRFVSPLEAEGCENVNTWPVLATETDDSILAAPIFLPDHPQIAPESFGDLFDATEIEEALLLHVHALSDAEREELAGQDPTVRAMLDRASATGAEEIMSLHGMMRPTAAVPAYDPRRGEPEATVDGVTFRPGGKVVLRLGDRTDVYDGMLDGRTATIERIYVDYDDAVHLCVTVDDDPGQDIMRDIGRYLYFKPTEVEVSGP